MTAPQVDAQTTGRARGGRGVYLGATAVLGLVATGLFIGGIVNASTTMYLIGLCLIPIVLTLLITMARPFRKGSIRLVVLLVTAGVVISAGVLIPQRSLRDEFDGDGVLWRTAGIDSGQSIAAVTDSVVVLRDTGGGLAFLSMADGHQLGGFQASSSDTVLTAGDNVLVEPAPALNVAYRLFGPDGNQLWEHPAPDQSLTQALAFADGVTVLELCDAAGCRREGVDLAGEVVWTSDPTAYAGPTSYPLPKPSRALPAVAVWPVPVAGSGTSVACGCDWQFASAVDGQVSFSANGSHGYVVPDADGEALVVTDRATAAGDVTFEIYGSDGRRQTGTVTASTAQADVVGSNLIFADVAGSSVLDTRQDATALERAVPDRIRVDRVDPYGQNEIGFSRSGVVAVDGGNVTWTAFGSSEPAWAVDSGELDTGAVVGLDTAAVITPLDRTNPMDQGYSKISDTRDRRVTVVDVETGAQLAQVRTEWRPRVIALPAGALVIDSDVLIRLGSAG